MKNEIMKIIGGIKNNNTKGLLYDFLMYVKYTIEKNKLDYYQIVDGNITELVKLLKDSLRGTIYVSCIKTFMELKLYKRITSIAFRDYEIDTYYDRVIEDYIKNNKKYLVISSKKLSYIKYNVDVVVHGNIELDRYKLLDEIYGLKRNVILEVYDMSKYDSIIYVCGNKYIDYDYTINKEMLFVYDYSYASNLLNIPNMLIEIYKVNSIFLDKDNVYIKYDNILNKDKKISIKDLSNIDNEELNDVINSKVKGITKSIDDIKNNYYRIGLNDKNSNSKDKIIRLVEYNKFITFKIKDIDSKLYSKIDKVLNKKKD